MKIFQLASFIAISLASTRVGAWFRVPCGEPLVQERVDPVISPTKTPSNHVHTVHGAKNFAANSTFATLRASSCTSCQVTQDLSNYWFPKLYFKDPSAGTFEPVPNGGLLVYYQNRGDGDVKNGGKGLKAFPVGFKMLSGNPRRRAKKFAPLQGSQGELGERAIQWACLRPGTAGYDNTDGSGNPHTNCENGFNARIHMPACWDGVNVDSANHVDHVAYLSGLDNGACPSTHPVTLLKLFYEITWDVGAFTSRWNGVNWPFVYATGDPTGYSWHGDFQNGWDPVVLQNAIDKCDNPNDQTSKGITEACSYLTVVNAAISNQCKTAAVVNEVIDGKLSRLPGCNPIQSGPGDATLYDSSNCPI